MASRLRGPGVLLAVALTAPAIAHAEPTSADRETARVLMQEGRELRDKGDLKEALKRFKGADDIMHVPTTALEVAKVEVALGLLVEARDAIAAIRLVPVQRGEPAPFKEARARADELDASLNGRIPALVITLTNAPAGETPSVSVDGTLVPAGVLGLSRTVDPGHHVVSAKTAHGEGKAEIDVREGEKKTVSIRLVITEAPAAPPAEASPAPPPPSPTRSHGPTALTWVAVGLTGVGIGAGVVTGVLSMSKTSALQSECPNHVCGPSQRSDYDAANTLATVSTIGFITAGAGAALSIVTLLVGHAEAGAGPGEAPTSGVLVTPVLGPFGGGVRGTF